MSHPGTTPADTAEIDPLAQAPAWARGRMLRHLELLDEAADVGAEVVRAIGRKIAEDPAVDVEAAARAYAKASRALRQTIALQDRLMQDIVNGGEDDQDWPEREARQKARASRIVGRIADLDEEKSDARFIKEVQERAEDLLDDEDLYGDVLERSLSDVVDQLCGNMGLKPNWSRIAAEPWAVKELDSGRAWTSLQAAAAEKQTRPPPQAGGEEPSPEASDRTALRDSGNTSPLSPGDEHARLKFLIASLDALERTAGTAEGAAPPLSSEPADLFPAPA